MPHPQALKLLLQSLVLRSPTTSLQLEPESTYFWGVDETQLGELSFGEMSHRDSLKERHAANTS
jgi:hypothetical protein